MNLRAKGFYLENADEISKVEVREHEERREIMAEIQRRQNELLAVIGGDDEEASLAATEELKQLTHLI